MAYLNKRDSEILIDADRLLRKLAKNSEITKEEKAIVNKFHKWRNETEGNSLEQRIKAKAFVQEKRKIDKNYAHTRKKTDEQ